LVESPPHRLAGDREVVVPDLLAEGVEPRELLVVHPRLSRPRVDDRQVAPVVREGVVLEGDDTADRVDAARFQVAHERVEVAERRGTLRARREGLRDLGGVEIGRAQVLTRVTRSSRNLTSTFS